MILIQQCMLFNTNGNLLQRENVQLYRGILNFQTKVHKLTKSYFKNPNFLDARNSNSMK